MITKFISPNNEYPRHVGDILVEHPEWDETLDNLPTGWTPVEDSEMPLPKDGMLIFEEFPEQIDGTYYQKWVQRPLTQEEQDRIAQDNLILEQYNSFRNMQSE